MVPTPNQSILLVEDDPDSLQFYRTVLGRAFEGFDILCATSASEAEAYLGMPGIGTVVADYRLGTENGLDLLAAVQRASPDVARILLTGCPEWAQADPRAGAAQRIVSKDEHPLKVAYIVRSHLQGGLTQPQGAALELAKAS